MAPSPKSHAREAEDVGDQATVLVDPVGQFLDASPAALELFGVSLSELRSLPPGVLSVQPVDPEVQSAGLAAWEAAGAREAVGEGTLRRPDGALMRVRFAIVALGDGFRLAIEPAPGAVDAPTRAFTIGRVLTEWRDAERRLEALEPESAEWRAAQTEIAGWRSRYQELFEAAKER